MIKKKLFLFPILTFLLILLIDQVSAHCPLCTAGAAVAAGGAVWLGVSPAVVAIFIGAFAISMGIWTSNWLKKKFLKKKYIPFQTQLIILVIFLGTVIPIIPQLLALEGFNLFLYGSYGGLLNRSYMINISWITSLVGGGIVFISPSLSKKITKLRKDKIIPFQGMILTLLLLVIFGGILQLII